MSILKVWQAHMMRPSLYRDACIALIGQGGNLIDYDPATADTDQKNEGLRRTRMAYLMLYGHPAPVEIWKGLLPGPQLQKKNKSISSKITSWEYLYSRNPRI